MTIETENKPDQGIFGRMVTRWKEAGVTQLREIHDLRKELRRLSEERQDSGRELMLSLIGILDSCDSTAATIDRALTEEDRKARRVLNTFGSLRRNLASVLKKYGATPMGTAVGAEFVAGLHKGGGTGPGGAGGGRPDRGRGKRRIFLGWKNTKIGGSDRGLGGAGGRDRRRVEGGFVHWAKASA